MPQALNAAVLLAALIVVGVPFALQSSFVYLGALAFCYSLPILSLMVLTGKTGQVSLGHGTFFALGAYSAAILDKASGWNPIAAFPIAALVSLCVGLVCGVPAMRLAGASLAIVTLALSVATPALIKHFDSLSGGAQGISLTHVALPTTVLTSVQTTYLVAAAVAGLALLGTRQLTSGNVGRALNAIRVNEQVAQTMGIDTARVKVLAFGYSAMLAGVGGAAYAGVVGYVSPDTFGLFLGVTFIVGLVIGGQRSLAGSLIGSLVVVLLPNFTGKMSPAISGLVYGLLVLMTMMVMPAGMVGLWTTFVNDIRARRTNTRRRKGTGGNSGVATYSIQTRTKQEEESNV